MKYKVIQRKNPQDPKAESLFYANAVNEGKFSLRDFATLRLNLQSKGAQQGIDAMAAMGIAKDRLQSAGKGQTSPIADNGTDEGRAKNRRVEFVKI
jgi:hypothetical protein